MGAKEAYDHHLKKIEKLDPTPNNIFDTYLTEKALEVS